MNDDITVDRSTLYVQQHHIDQFKSIANNLKEFDYILKDAGLSKQDCWIIAFHVWILMLPDHHNIIHSAEKILFYPSNHIVKSALINNKSFQQIKNKSNLPQEYHYIASLTFANGINEWVLYLYHKYDLHELIERNKEKRYFDSHRGSEEEVKLFTQHQAKVVKATVRELQSSDSFNKKLEDCYDEAIRIYSEKFKLR